jgi:hypothetical protein
MRSIVNAKAPGSHEGLFNLNIGGTSATRVNTALQNLNGIDKNSINRAGGPVQLNEYGIIPEVFLPKSIKQRPTILGPVSLSVETSATYTITNYDSKNSYDLSLLVLGAGTVVRNDNVITYTSPNSLIVGSGGLYGFKLNDHNFLIRVGLSNPVLPIATISHPTQNLVIQFLTLYPPAVMKVKCTLLLVLIIKSLQIINLITLWTMELMYQY